MNGRDSAYAVENRSTCGPQVTTRCVEHEAVVLMVDETRIDKDDYGKYKYFPFEYAEQLLKLGKKLQLDEQQKIKANKLYRKDRK